MAGKIRKMIDAIVDKRSRGVSRLAYTTRTKMLIKGIDSGAYNDNSADDPIILEKLKQFAIELGVDIHDAGQAEIK